jgi:hypothetical protein
MSKEEVDTLTLGVTIAQYGNSIGTSLCLPKLAIHMRYTE